MFSQEFLLALSNWQNGWSERQEQRRVIADELVRTCEHLAPHFKTTSIPCYRKRFIVEGEIVPILMDDQLFEGIASWTTDLSYAKDFKGLVRPDTKFAIIFKHKPLPQEIVVNISLLWKDHHFKKAAEEFQAQQPESAKALFNFKDLQSEVILRSTLKGSEIESLVTTSSSFDEICDLGGIPDEQRKELSKKYALDPEGIPISMPVYTSRNATKRGIKKVISKMKNRIQYAQANRISIDWGKSYSRDPEDQKHIPDKPSQV